MSCSRPSAHDIVVHSEALPATTLSRLVCPTWAVRVRVVVHDDIVRSQPPAGSTKGAPAACEGSSLALAPDPGLAAGLGGILQYQGTCQGWIDTQRHASARMLRCAGIQECTRIQSVWSVGTAVYDNRHGITCTSTSTSTRIAVKMHAPRNCHSYY